MKTVRSRRVTAGLTLIVLGLGLYLFQRLDGLGDSAVFVIIGAAFLAAYLYNRVYGYLVPAGILLGMGAGSIAEQLEVPIGDPTLLGLGAGFLLIYIVSLAYERRNQWWPLIPGAALIFSGLPHGWGVFGYLLEHWPLILVVVGALILVGAFARKGSGGGSTS